MDWLWWTLTISLMATGLVGTFLPMLPGSALILAGAAVHYLFLGPDNTITLVTLLGLLALTILSLILDQVAGVVGAKLFGATRLGFWGGVIGGLAGFIAGFAGWFFVIGPIIGGLLGTVVGVFSGERLAGRPVREAWRATWGTLVGAATGFVGKGLISLAMILWFILDLLWG